MTLQKGDMAEDFELLAHDGTIYHIKFIQKLKKMLYCVFTQKTISSHVLQKKSLRWQKV